MAFTELTLTDLPARRPYKCPETEPSWRYLRSAHTSVTGLFDGLHQLRLVEQQGRDKDTRGKLSDDQKDLLRAALVFTSSGLDACVTRLLRDTLATLIASNKQAEKEFKDWVSRQLNSKVPGNIREAILDQNPRDRLVDHYIENLAKPSLQGTDDLIKVRKALGLTETKVSQESVDQLKPFFAARNEIVHELDLTEPTGPGSSARRSRSMEAVRDQCDRALQLLVLIIQATAETVKESR